MPPQPDSSGDDTEQKLAQAEETHADVDGKTLRSKVAKYLASMPDRELIWTRKQEFLKARGYVLRPRYQLFWTPSWSKAGLSIIPPYTEDAVALPVSVFA